jgi:putative oxidoreductase
MNSVEPLYLVRRAYAFLIAAASSLQSPFLLFIRLYWGWQFFLSGKGKLTGHEQVVEYFNSLDIPFPALSAWMAGTTECVGGLLLLIGLASRLTAVPLIFTMCVAYATAEFQAVKSIFSDPDKFTGATPFLFLFAAVIVFIFGPGVFSVDWLLARKSSATQPPHRSMFL